MRGRCLIQARTRTAAAYILSTVLLAVACWSLLPGFASAESYVTSIPIDDTQSGLESPLAIQSWLVAGPFPSPEVPEVPVGGPRREGYTTDFLASVGGEERARPVPGTRVPNPAGGEISFTPHTWPGPYADLAELFGRDEFLCAYVYAELESELAQDVFLHVGTNDAGKVWLGGELIVAYSEDRTAMPSQHVVRVLLPAGRTPLLVKLDQAGGGWGTYVEVYGRARQRAFTEINFPGTFTIEADDFLPNGGEDVTVRIANWLPPEPPIAVTWERIDAAEARPLDSQGPAVTVRIPEAPPDAIRLRATATHPRGGRVVGECTLMPGGEDVIRGALTELEAIAAEVGEPRELEGRKRDAYALALLMRECLERREIADDVSRIRAEMGDCVVRMREALDAFRAGVDPYVGMGGKFEAAYLSDADGTAQPFTMAIPGAYSAETPYPVLMLLHGAARTHETEGDWWSCLADRGYESTTIGVSVMGRGQFAGYMGLAEDDVLRVLDWVRGHYTVDAGRIYLTGGSMGGGGVWRIASHYPHLFAAGVIDCGSPLLRTLPNLTNLPLYVNHGDLDQHVPVAGARLGVQIMQRAGCPVVYSEFPGVDHGVNVPSGSIGYMTRIATHRRVVEPSRIHISAEHTQHADMYWGRIERWEDPHRPARLDAQILPANTISVNMTNVAKARLAPPAKWTIEGNDIVWMVQGCRLVTPWNPEGAYDVLVTGDGPEVRAHAEQARPAVRPYAQGSFMALYRGEPLLIVYGTQAKDAELTDSIRNMAETLAAQVGPGGGPMEFGTIPVVADMAASEAQLASNNLFLVGGLRENAVTARLMADMPIREEDGSLIVFGAERVPLDGRGYGFVYTNPEHPQRLVFVYASSVPAFYQPPEPFAVSGSRVLGMAWQDPLLPDLFVETPFVGDDGKVTASQVVRTRFFTHGWQPVETPACTIARHPGSASVFSKMVGDTFRAATGAAFALVGAGGQDDPCPYDPATAEWRDIAFLAGDGRVYVFEATGEELLELAQPDEDKWWAILPAPEASTIDTAATYRVAGYMESLWGLTDAMYTPRGLRYVDDADAFDAAARAVWGVREL